MLKILINISISKLRNIHVDLISTLFKIFLLVGKEFSLWACGDANRRQGKYLCMRVPKQFERSRQLQTLTAAADIDAIDNCFCSVFFAGLYLYLWKCVSWISITHNLTSAISRRSSSKSIPSYFHVAVALSPDIVYGPHSDCQKQLYFIRPFPT